jgi:hypothetical protein
MTDEQPNLNALSPVQASERLSQLGADESWRTAYLSGSVPHRKEADLLLQRAAMDERIDDIVLSAGADGAKLPTPGGANVHGLSANDVATAATWLHDAGLSDGSIGELLRGQAIPEEDYRKLEPQVREKFFGDREWVRRLMEGGAAERRQLLAWNIIKTNRKSAYAPTIAGGR